jgi:hypothetical protein
MQNDTRRIPKKRLFTVGPRRRARINYGTAIGQREYCDESGIGGYREQLASSMDGAEPRHHTGISS